MAKQATIEDIGRAIRREVGGFETATNHELRSLWNTFSEDRRGRMLEAVEEPKAARQKRTPKMPPAASDAGGETITEVGDTNDEPIATVPDGPVQTDAEG